MKKALSYLLVLSLAVMMFSGCTVPPSPSVDVYEGTQITLSDSGITVDGSSASADQEQAVYIANDIVYYEDGHDFTYGEGSKEDAHSAEEAAAHTVVHITKPGMYILSGKLSLGQIAIDLGEDAKEDADAVVQLVLMGVDITCTVAPAIIFYRVYECGSDDAEDASMDVYTDQAGANIIVADGTENTVNGSYVARIYKPGTVELNEDGTEVKDAKKLHKYDGAVYSKMSMNVSGGSSGDGILNINAENEGLDSELHLTIHGGCININSGNDGINTNEDGVSVTTINGGTLNILVNGATGEGDGIDSNGWLVINGGTVIAQACSFSGDAGIDSDMGIHINGGTVIATGNMLDHISESRQNYAVFQFAGSTSGTFTLINNIGAKLLQQTITNSFTYLVISRPGLVAEDYTLWQDDTQLQGVATENMGGQGPGGMMPPEGMTPPDGGMEPPQGGMEPPQGQQPPAGGQPPQGGRPGEGNPNQQPGGGFAPGVGGKATKVFTIQDGGSYFVSVQKVQ